MQRWRAPVATGPVTADVPIPGSKSLTNRVLVLAALSDRPAHVGNPLRARDTELMADALRALGTGIADDGAGDWVVTPSRVIHGPAEIDCGLAGTVMRFVPPIATLTATADEPVTFDGDPRARHRPMAALIEALRAIGAGVEDGDRGTLPISVTGGPGVRGGAVRLDASASSQFVSALLLTGARWPHGMAVQHAGPAIPSLPHIAMTIATLRRAGVSVTEQGADHWEVGPGPIHQPDVAIEPDLSGAAPFLAAAVVTGGRVTIEALTAATVQPVARLCEILEGVGATWSFQQRGLTVTGTDRISGLDADLAEIGELVPVIAALASLADEPSRLRGIGHLRGHETDRLAALATELNGLGGQVAETDDGLIIEPRPLRAGVFHSHGDHRLAHAAAVLGLVTTGIEVDGIGGTAKTMPDFVERWQAMLGSRP
ncbi:MAG TPA: 3-phosphoshikimate 1-carboxyvinyltransferase [Actinomycetes bacterium]|nr:3-phosphoshikimate 1-carboxyvinyltransferase [Actinomycetes bacterium]